MSDQLQGNERTLALAALMVEALRVRCSQSDADMDAVMQTGLWTLGAADAGNEEAKALILEALGKITAGVAALDEVRATKKPN